MEEMHGIAEPRQRTEANIRMVWIEVGIRVMYSTLISQSVNHSAGPRSFSAPCDPVLPPGSRVPVNIATRHLSHRRESDLSI